MEELNENTHESSLKIRPTFLTVVCILSFIGSGFGIFSAITDYAGAELAAQSIDMVDDAMEEAMDEMEDAEAPESVTNFFQALMGDIQSGLTADNIRNNALGSGLSCLLTLAGALLMWFLNRKGFYLYIVGIIIYIVTPIMVYDGLMATIQASTAAFIGIVFSILYGVNLKHLK